MQSNVYIESLECPGSMENGKSAQGNVEAQRDDRWYVCICPAAPVYLYVCLCAPVDIRYVVGGDMFNCMLRKSPRRCVQRQRSLVCVHDIVYVRHPIYLSMCLYFYPSICLSI